MFGKLTLDALPFYSWVAVGGAVVTVIAAIAIVTVIRWQRRWTYLWARVVHQR